MQNIQGTFSQLDKIREKMNTGKEINRPSDDPIGLQKVLSLGSSIRENERYIDNINLGVDRMNAATSSLEQVENILIDIKELLAVQSSDAATSAERRAAVKEMDLLLDQIVNLANKRYQGKFLFGGVHTTSGACALSLPFNVQRATDGTISGVIQNPRGINTLINTTILPGVNDALNISGAAPFQPNGAKGSGDIFQLMIDIRSQLATNDIAALDASSLLLDNAIAQVTEQDLILGTKINKFEQTKATLEATIVNEKQAKSRVENSDYAALLIEYSTAETLFNATLSATSTLLQNSLMNFI
jgi:flagellar hook-associated protein 3 FlgL